MNRRERALRLRAQNGYSVSNIAHRLAVKVSTVEGYLRELSPLNLAVNRRYQKCQERGGCTPSTVYVRRPFPAGDLELPVCRLCDVPMRGKSRAATWNYTDASRGVA